VRTPATRAERVGFGGLLALTVAVVALVLALVGYVFVQGVGVLGWEFLSQSPREGMLAGGIFPAIVGTLGLTLLTSLVAVPLGVASAVYLVEYARDGWWVRLVRLSIRNLSGVPSVVFGLFGVGLFVHGLDLGLSMLASGLTLGLLTLPTVITASEESLRTVPKAWRDGALALGATRWEAVWTNVLPAAFPGIVTGVILGLARAAGETAPILFTGVSFFLPQLPHGILEPFMALPYHLYILSTQHQDLARARPVAFGTATVLILVVGLLNGMAAVLRARARAAHAGRG
jgi:phosphate transport system permease protein